MSNTQDELTNLRVTKQLQSYSKAKLIQMVRETFLPQAYYLRGCEDAVNSIRKMIEDPYTVK